MPNRRPVEQIVLPSRGEFEPFNGNSASTVVFMFLVGHDRASVVEHIRGLSSTVSEVATSQIENGIAFTDGSIIVVDKWKSSISHKQADILVLGDSAFDILPDSDSRVTHKLVAGFRYRISYNIASRELLRLKQPIAP